MHESDPNGMCTEEGFYPHPDDPTRFYRCRYEHGEMVKYDFQCQPGTVYHPELATCVHPWDMPPDHPSYIPRPS